MQPEAAAVFKSKIQMPWPVRVDTCHLSLGPRSYQELKYGNSECRNDNTKSLGHFIANDFSHFLVVLLLLRMRQAGVPHSKSVFEDPITMLRMIIAAVLEKKNGKKVVQDTITFCRPFLGCQVDKKLICSPRRVLDERSARHQSCLPG